jgi:pyruvate kinase
MIDKISRRIEVEMNVDDHAPAVFATEKMKMLHAAVVLANELPHSHLMTFTRQGFMAAGLAALRPVHSPIIAVTPHVEVLRQLRLLRAVEPVLMPFTSDPSVTIENAIAVLRDRGLIKPGEKLIIATDILAHDRLVDAVQLRTVR